MLALLIAKQALDYEIDGAWKTAGVVFLAAWAVLAFAIYVSNVWDKRRLFMSVVWVLAGVLLFTIWWAYLPPPPPAAASEPASIGTESEPYPFREKPKEVVTFIFGSNAIELQRELLSKEPQTVPLKEQIGPESYNSISLYLKDGKPFVDVKMWGDGDPNGTGATYLVEVNQNEFIVRPPAWDRNFNSQAFEVVNEYGTPMLQIYYKQADVIVINGVFKSKPYITYASEESGVHVRVFERDPQPPPPALNKIFQYPSMKHRGEFAPDWKPLADATTAMPKKSDLDITKPVK